MLQLDGQWLFVRVLDNHPLTLAGYHDSMVLAFPKYTTYLLADRTGAADPGA